MTDAQIFQFLGIMYLVVGIGIIFNPGFYRRLLAGFAENPHVAYISATGVLLIGYVLVTFHNVWTGGWTVVITVVGWMALIKGIFILTLPDVCVKLCKALMNKKNTYYVAGSILVTMLGLLFLYLGYFALNK